MKIFISDISAEGLKIEAESKKHRWLHDLLGNTLPEIYGKEDSAKLSLQLHCFEDNVDIQGTLAYTIHAPCDRCGKDFSNAHELPIKFHLAPLYEGQRQAKRDSVNEDEIIKDDENFSYYKGDHFELDAVLAEQILLNQPMQHLCGEACKGLCSDCGQDLNEGSCTCSEGKVDARWDALSQYKAKK